MCSKIRTKSDNWIIKQFEYKHSELCRTERNYQLDLYHKINFPITQGATRISFKINKGDPYFRFCTQGADPTSPRVLSSPLHRILSNSSTKKAKLNLDLTGCKWILKIKESRFFRGITCSNDPPDIIPSKKGVTLVAQKRETHFLIFPKIIESIWLG